MNIINKMATWWLTKSLNVSQAFKVLWDQTGSNKRAVMPYRQVDVVFACVEKLLSAIVSRNVPLVLSTVDEEIVEAGPVYDRLFGNPNQSFDRFASDWLGSYILFRDVFIRFDDPIAADSPYEAISGPRMIEQVDYAAGRVARWQYMDDFGRVCYCTPQQVKQTKNFNPYNRFHGTGPLAACDNAIQYCYSLILRNASAMRNGAEPGVILEAPQGANLSPEQRDAFLAAFDSRFAGPDKTMSTALLTGGVTAKTLALKMVDLQASQIDQAQACRIAAAIGTPPQLVGLVTEAQYSGGPAMRDFIFNSAMPLSALFSGVITDSICQRAYPSTLRCMKYKESKFYDGRNKSLIKNKSYRLARTKAMQYGQRIFAWFDWSQHPVVQEAQMDWTTKVLDYTNKGVPLNNIIEAHDLPYEKQPWGDDVLVSLGQVTARSIIDGTSNPLGEDLPEEQADNSPEKAQDEIIKEIAKYFACCENEKAKSNDDKRARIWKKWAASWQSIEREYQESLRGLFREQRKDLITNLQSVMSGEKTIKADTSDIVARVVFDIKKYNGKIRVINKVFYEKSSKLGAVQTLTETSGLSGNALKEAVTRIQLSADMRRTLEISSSNITKVNTTTQTWVTRQLREGLEKGEGLKELTDRLADNKAFSRERAGAIARTQTAGAVSSGRNAGMKEAGVEKKAWLTSRDNEVRSAHKAAEKQYAAGIPIDQPFVVGGEKLMYPGDPDGSAAQIANCRCLQIPVFSRDKELDLDGYDKKDFITYDNIKTLLSED